MTRDDFSEEDFYLFKPTIQKNLCYQKIMCVIAER
jgi:hypothetical protein